jgi:hypothetical protein
VRELYPPKIKPKLGSGIGAKGRLPDRPTTAWPGSPEKVAVLEERARLGLALFHPDDATLELREAIS